MAKEQAQSPSWSLQERTDWKKKKKKKIFPRAARRAGGRGPGGQKKVGFFWAGCPPGAARGPTNGGPISFFFRPLFFGRQVGRPAARPPTFFLNFFGSLGNYLDLFHKISLRLKFQIIFLLRIQLFFQPNVPQVDFLKFFL